MSKALPFMRSSYLALFLANSFKVTVASSIVLVSGSCLVIDGLAARVVAVQLLTPNALNRCENSTLNIIDR